MSRFFWIILAIIGGGLILLVLNHDSGTTFGIGNDAFAHTLYFGIWALVIGAAIAGSRLPLGEMARNIAIWLLLALVLVAVYQYRYELQDVASRLAAGLVPGSPISRIDADGISVMLEKRASGHFEARGMVNGTPIRFLIDTGATRTVLAYQDAMRLGFDPDSLTFSIPVMTANGEARAAAASADEIRIGDIARQRVPILVTGPGQLDQSLLGMNFLGSLSGLDVRGDRLILRD